MTRKRLSIEDREKIAKERMSKAIGAFVSENTNDDHSRPLGDQFVTNNATNFVTKNDTENETKTVTGTVTKNDATFVPNNDTKIDTNFDTNSVANFDTNFATDSASDLVTKNDTKNVTNFVPKNVSKDDTNPVTSNVTGNVTKIKEVKIGSKKFKSIYTDNDEIKRYAYYLRESTVHKIELCAKMAGMKKAEFVDFILNCVLEDLLKNN